MIKLYKKNSIQNIKSVKKKKNGTEFNWYTNVIYFSFIDIRGNKFWRGFRQNAVRGHLFQYIQIVIFLTPLNNKFHAHPFNDEISRKFVLKE